MPWLILFPKDYNNNFCTLFNPEEKNKLYKTQDLGFEFAKSDCVATCGNWLLMQDPRINLYMVNLFTQERINLPHAESQLGTTKIKRTLAHRFIVSNAHKRRKIKGINIMQSPVFWFDEKTKDYVVLWGVGEWCVVYSKKGDNVWNQIPETSDCYDLVYKDHKLYFLSGLGSFKIFDFSQEIPQETFMCSVVVKGLELGTLPPVIGNSWEVFSTKLVVTVTGDVLKVEKLCRSGTDEWSFCIYKVCSSGFFKKCDSLGDEAMILDLGITVLANDDEGFNRNSIYVNGRHARTEIFLFNLETQKMEQLHKFDCSSIQFSDETRWFLPSFTKT